MTSRSRLKNSEHRIGGAVYFLTRVEGHKSKWRIGTTTYPSHAAAVRAIQVLRDKQIEKNRAAFQANNAKQVPGGYLNPVPPKLIRSLPPTEGTGLPDTRPLMQQALEDLSDGDLLQLVRDRGLVPTLCDEFEQEVRECLPERPITLGRITDLSLDDLVADQKNGRGAEDFCQWIDGANRTDVRKALTELDFSLSELASLVEQAVDATCPQDVREVIGKYLDSDIGAAPDMTFAYLAREAITREDKAYYAEQFTKEVLRG
jgi:hypothetical protein